MTSPADLFERLPALVNGDEALLRRGAYCDSRIAVGIGDTPFYLTFQNGRLAALERGPALMRSWQFAFKATEEAWRQYWTAVPRPGWHDPFALVKRGAASLEGDLAVFFRHLQFYKDVLAKPRGLLAGGR